MKKLAVQILVVGLAGASLVALPAQASETGKSTTKCSQRQRTCHRVNVAAMTKSAPAAPRDREAFGSEFYNQHPSGGG